MDHNARGYSDYVKAQFNSWLNITDIFYEVTASQWMVSFDDVQAGDDNYQHRLIMKRARASSEDPPYFDYSGLSTVLLIRFLMAQALACCNLRDVTTFRLNLDIDDVEMFVKHPSFDKIIDLLLNLGTVTTFQTNEKTLNCLLLIEKPSFNSSFLFSGLNTIIVDTWGKWLDYFLMSFKENEKENRQLTRVLFSEHSLVPIRDPTVLEKASRFGITVGWTTNKGIREFPPK